jgi:AcrR family transcriptional regulator
MSESRALPRGRHRLSREAVAESQRERMLEAIVDLVAHHGYAGTTVGGIAATAGVSRTTFYEQFETKEDCFRAAYDSVTGRLIEAIEDSIAPTEGKGAKLRTAITASLKWFADHPDAAVAFLVEVHTAGPEALDQREAIIERFCQVIYRNAPETRPAAAMAVVTAIDAMAHEKVRKGRGADLPELADDACYVAEKLLL